jgi:hypothetical protein
MYADQSPFMCRWKIKARKAFNKWQSIFTCPSMLWAKSWDLPYGIKENMTQAWSSALAAS